MARVLAKNIRKFLNHIKEAPAQLATYGLFNKVNETLEKLLSVKISSLSQSEPLEDTKTPSQERFWEQAVKVMEEIEKTMKVKETSEGPSYNLGLSPMTNLWSIISAIARQHSDKEEEDRRKKKEEEDRMREEEEKRKEEEDKRRREEEEAKNEKEARTMEVDEDEGGETRKREEEEDKEKQKYVHQKEEENETKRTNEENVDKEVKDGIR